MGLFWLGQMPERRHEVRVDEDSPDNRAYNVEDDRRSKMLARHEPRLSIAECEEEQVACDHSACQLAPFESHAAECKTEVCIQGKYSMWHGGLGSGRISRTNNRSCKC